MPKVLRILNRFNLGGPTFNAAYLAKYLSPDFDTLLVGGSIDKSEESSMFILNNLGLHPFIVEQMKREIDPKNDIEAYYRIKAIIKKYKPDIVHTHASKAGILGRKAAFECKIPVIVHTFHGHVFHSYFNSLQSETFIRIERSLAKKTTRIIAISDIQKDELCNRYKIAGPDKIIVIPLGFDLSRFREDQEKKRMIFRQQFNIGDDEIAIAIVGRLVPVKNHGLFLRSLKYVMENSNKKIRAFIVGDGESKQMIMDLAMNLGIEYSDLEKKKTNAPLTFTSWIKDVDYVYSGSDIVALSSLNEGTPVSLIEAQAANKPVISTDVGGIRNIVKPGITAILVSSSDEGEFSRQLLSLVEDSELRNRLSLEGWKNVEDKFHYKRLVNDMKELYFNLLGS